VISNPKFRKGKLQEYVTSILERIALLDEANETFRLRDYPELCFQQSKTLVYHFNHKASLALIEKFQTELEKRASEFRYMPEEGEGDSEFSNEAYQLIYDDSQAKIKTLKDYRENRYGLSSYLSKKIFLTLRNGLESAKDESDNILRFFKGRTNLEQFRQWEKLCTLFVVTGNRKALTNFYAYSVKQLFSKVESSEKIESMRTGIANDLIEHLHLSIEMALCLDPSFAESVKNEIGKIQSKHFRDFANTEIGVIGIPFSWRRIRISNMMRHHYVKQPLANFTVQSKNGQISLIGDGNDGSGYDLDSELMDRSPRRIKFWEAAWRKCSEIVNSTEQPPQDLHRLRSDFLYGPFEDFNSASYLYPAFDDFWQINFWWYGGDGNYKERLRNQYFNIGEITRTDGLIVEEVHVPSGGTLNSSLRVGVANVNVHKQDYEDSMLARPRNFDRYLEYALLLNTAERENCDLITLPELCFPYSSVWYLAGFSWRNQKGVVTGLEHWPHNGVAFNFILTLLPCIVNGVRDTVPVLRLKNHYAPSEEVWINDFERVVPKPDPYRYHLFRWKQAYFTTFYCFELADITHRSLFRSKLDFLVAPEWNPDTPYFSNIVESTSRDIHCYFVQSNTSQFGDSRVTKPGRTVDRDLVRISGGKNTVLVVEDLEIERLRDFQYKGIVQQKEDSYFKPAPPDFNREDVRIRQDNLSYTED